MEPDELTKKYGIGLTGGIATGKSSVAHIIRKLGHVVFDADQLSRDAVKAGTRGLADLTDLLGSKILNSDGQLNRGKLRDIIFDDKSTRSQVENILHPAIKSILHENLKQANLINTPQIWFYEAALIFETNSQDRFREVWVTHCSEEKQINRLTIRDNISESSARKIIESQMASHEKAKKAHCVIDTNQSMTSVKQQTDDNLRRLKNETP